MWRYPTHINPRETRAIVLSNEIVPKILAFRGCEFLDLGDNRAADGSYNHGRSPKCHMNRPLIRRAAYEAVSDTRGRSVWGPSAVQPGDWGTREGLRPTMSAALSGLPLPLFPSSPVIVLSRF